MLFALIFLLFSASGIAADAIVEDHSFDSQVMGETRNFRIILPPDYAKSEKRYPVIYWFHGYGQRHNFASKQPERDQDTGYAGDNFVNYVAKNDVIVVKIDGYNPRTPGEKYVRPWNVSPVETQRQFPLLFPEIVAHIDRNYRTIADREHRATAGLSMGGFMSFWVSGKYPHLVSSASNFMGSSEFSVGPRGFDVEYRHDEMRDNYEGVRTRIVLGLRDFILFYHRRMNAIWKYAAPRHEWDEYDFDHGTPGIARTFDFHMRSFREPLPRPDVWTHHDVYPNFDVWGWGVLSDRRQPGITTLANVSAKGFRSSVREWLFDGALIPDVKLAILTGPVFPPKKPQKVTVVRTRDGLVYRQTLTADAQGQLAIELSGDEYEVGIGPDAVLSLRGFQLDGMEWATAGKPVKGKARFWNKGAVSSKPVNLKWISSNPDLQYETPTAALPALEPGKFADVPLAFTVTDPEREIVKMYATGEGGVRLPLEIALFPGAPVAEDFRISDGANQPVYRKAVQVEQTALGNGNADGKAAPGERFAILLRDGEAWRAAELFTNHPCVAMSSRLSDVWSSYDHVGASAKATLMWVKEECVPGTKVRMLARVVLPNKPLHRLRYAAIEFPVVAKE
jgi:S-formylglutathione hydrolase FrmB